jgi:hypothetical protein
MIVLTDTAAWILIAMGASNNGNATAGIGIGMDASSNGSGTAALLLILITMVAIIGALIVPEIPNIGTVSIGKLRAVEYSRILERGRGIAAARVFFFLNRNFCSVVQFVPVTVRRQHSVNRRIELQPSQRLRTLVAPLNDWTISCWSRADHSMNIGWSQVNKSLFIGERSSTPLPAKALLSGCDCDCSILFHIN